MPVKFKLHHYQPVGNGLVSNYPLCLRGQDGALYARRWPRFRRVVRRKGKKPMTVCAGFVHREGVLLCADTQHEGWDIKLHAAKMRHFDCPSGRVGLTYAGNANFATAVGQKLEREVKALSKGADLLLAIEKIIDKEYRRLVYRNPHPDDPAIDYGFLMAIQPRNGTTKLYLADRVAVMNVPTYKLIGIGETFGAQLVEPGFTLGADPEQMLVLAVYAMALVKEHVPGCGGLSMYLDLRNDGSYLEYYGEPLLERLEKWVGVYHLLTWNLLNQFADRTMSEADFIRNLEEFGHKLVQARRNFDDDKKLIEMRREAMRMITQGKI